jgi:hypothetical protein
VLVLLLWIGPSVVYRPSTPERPKRRREEVGVASEVAVDGRRETVPAG